MAAGVVSRGLTRHSCLSTNPTRPSLPLLPVTEPAEEALAWEPHQPGQAQHGKGGISLGKTIHRRSRHPQDLGDLVDCEVFLSSVEDLCLALGMAQSRGSGGPRDLSQVSVWDASSVHLEAPLSRPGSGPGPKPFLHLKLTSWGWEVMICAGTESRFSARPAYSTPPFHSDNLATSLWRSGLRWAFAITAAPFYGRELETCQGRSGKLRRPQVLTGKVLCSTRSGSCLLPASWETAVFRSASASKRTIWGSHTFPAPAGRSGGCSAPVCRKDKDVARLVTETVKGRRAPAPDLPRERAMAHHEGRRPSWSQKKSAAG